MLARDCLKLDYCPYETVLTTLGLKSLKKFIINEGYSTDGTFEKLSSIKDDRVEIIRRNWHMDKSFWSKERNYLIDIAKEQADYLLILDADEFLFEESLPLIDSFVKNPGDYLGLHFKYRHFFRIKTGNDVDSIMVNVNPKWYQHHAKLVNFSLNPRLEVIGHNADDFVGTKGNKTIFLHSFPGLKRDNNIFIGHLGYARDAEAAGIKFKRNDEIYQNSKEYIDGCIPKSVSFSYPKYTPDRNLIAIDFNLPLCIKNWIQSKERRDSFIYEV